MTTLIIYCIRFYQRFLSFDQGYVRKFFPNAAPICRFEPTCSTYALVAFGRYGFLKACYLSVSRILRCNPWGKDGWDPVP